MTHSLSAAVADGTITEEAAFCGLSIEDIHKLSRRFTQPLSYHTRAHILVRFRGGNGDARKVMTVEDLARWMGASGAVFVEGLAFHIDDIRDVTAVAE
jgi:hypothetical protein